MMKLALLFADALMSGGYPRDARWLAGALSRAGVDVSVFAGLGQNRKTDGLQEAIRLHHWRSLPVASKRFDLVHVFGLFSLTHPLVARTCASRGVPLVVSTLSHLLPLHMAIKRRKKELFLRTAWMPWIKRVNAFHVFSGLEAESVRMWVPNARLFEATLGIFPAAGQNLPRPASARGSARHFLFFGRNDTYQKGLDILVQSYASTVRSLGSDAAATVKLTIAGQPWGGSTRFLGDYLHRLHIQDSVTILGEVDDETKSRLLSEADYLIFLSRWDGPPRPIREAIAAGTPVIVTPESNMAGLVELFGAGLQVGLNVDEVAQGLSRAVLDSSLLDCCRRGVEQLKKHLDWDRVVEDYVKGYEEALCRPQFGICLSNSPMNT
jgi:glycosyltransferase involved in cell wall biosynthesis